MSFTTAASTFVASISPGCERKGPSFLPPEKKTHGRASAHAHSRRDFLLRALKPAVSSPDASEKCGSSDSPENGEAVGALIEMASVSSDPLPLHARRELARKRLRQRKLKKSFDSAVGAVDWLAADLAKLMSFAKTLPLFLNDKTREAENCDEEEGEENAGNAISNFVDQDMMAEEEASTPYPRCAWPRTTLKVESEAFFVEIPPLEESASGPRCSWPRTAISTSVRGNDALGLLTPDASSSLPPSSPSVSYPRCAWPRISPNGLSVIPEEEVEKKEVSFKNDVSNSQAQDAYPRCAWPRSSQHHLTLAPTRSFSNNPVSPLPSIETESARCSWPKASQATQALFPRCDWPKKSSTLAASSSAQAYLLQEDDTDTTAAGAGSKGADLFLTPPRCAWPRAILSSPPSPSRNAIDSDSVVGLIPLGPRCSWPRGAALSDRSPPTAALDPNGHTILAPKSPLPSVLPEFNSQFSEVELGPRCSWPRKAPEPLQSELPASPLGQTLAQSGVPLGPRCNWPRNVSSVSRPITPPTSAPSHTQLVAAPRCSWPRNTSPISDPLDLPSPSFSESQLIAGPRCNWPRTVSNVPKSVASTAPKSQVEAGPRCSWPRNTSPISGSLNPVTLSPPESQLTAGPRCSWPRNSEPLMASPITTNVATEPPTPLGPRCAWPRGNSSPETPFKVSLPSDPTMSESPVAKEPLPTPSIKLIADPKKEARNSNDVTWPRRVMATTVGLSLMNHFFTGLGGQAFAQPLEGLNLTSNEDGTSLAQEGNKSSTSTTPLSEKSMH